MVAARNVIILKWREKVSASSGRKMAAVCDVKKMAAARNVIIFKKWWEMVRVNPGPRWWLRIM
jgi:hypothetical protein